MKKIEIYNKLVRDKIPEKIEKNKEQAITRIMGDEEFKEALHKKLLEECAEVIDSDSKNETIEELADVYEVLKALAFVSGGSIDDVVEYATKKEKIKGGFHKRIFLEKTISKDLD